MSTVASPLPRARPLIHVESEADAEALLEAFRLALAADDCALIGTVSRAHVELYIHPEQRHFWSPWLSLAVRPAESGSTARGRFGPHPSVWTVFMFVYAALAFLGVMGLMFGASQLLAKMSPWGFWGIPIALGLAAFTYGAEFIGKGLGNEQMWVVRDFVVRTVESQDPQST